MKKALGIITARSGSKRLPAKHLLEVGGISLLERSIKSALDSEVLHDVILSTDDTVLAERGKAWGAQVPFMRPASLSEDNSKVIDVLVHAIDQCEALKIATETICLLQPTSPFRTAQHIDAAVRQFFQSPDSLSLMSVCRLECERTWLKEIDQQGRLQDLFSVDPENVYKGNSKPVYRLNGAIYIMRSSDLKRLQSFHTKKTLAFEMQTEDSLDIDELNDLELARIISDRTGK